MAPKAASPKSSPKASPKASPKKAPPPVKKEAAKKAPKTGGKAMTNVPPPERKKKAQAARKKKLRARLDKKRMQRRRHIDKEKEVIRRGYKYRRYFKGVAASEKNLRRQARTFGHYYVEPEAKIAFVVRIRGINDMPPKPKKILQLLRLRQIFNGVFVRLNKATLNMLRLVSPWIAWGYPSLSVIRRLFYKRGYCNFRGARLPLSNDLIEKALHKRNLICAEDLIFQIASCGKKFRDANRFMWPFKLRAPKGGLNAKRNHFVEGGDFGNRENLINKLLTRMI
eukprot:NODE_5163_length_975_cov_287.361502_g4953_i0.p1 GENE.NODE_5163_length_975_cov_287.361502_g4953_i0~~NODE_5163_length_975_cov_287.361502_g4953_i0.p1  ORF type:complete len:300 (-),score=105.94 NODE_5163_length_975_cov_287.361502_g4953_i0:76-921(-)